MKIHDHALKKLSLVLLMTIPMYAFSKEAKTISCPSGFTIKCVAVKPEHRCAAGSNSVCTITSSRFSDWTFAAPASTSSTGKKVTLFTNPEKSMCSCSGLQPGSYTLNYYFSYYGPVSGSAGKKAYCVFNITSTLDFAGLYNSHYKNTGSNWEKNKPNPGYVCQNASGCLFTKKWW